MTKETENKPAKEPKVKDIQNGVPRPGAGTKTGRIWEIADALSAELKKPVGRKLVLEQAAKEDINAATAATQYGRWRKYNGLEGRGTEDEAPAEETGKGKTSKGK
ncbi:hypothetical protein S0112_001 [Shewanella phage S0112]|nr:hypothetical protein S0112_001 [Shewanella phage S0112]